MSEDFKSMEPDFLERAKKGYICPVCGNGTGRDGTGITKDPKTGSWHCFKCGLHADTVDLIGLHFGLSEDADKFRKAREYYGVAATTGQDHRRRRNKNTQKETIDPPKDDFTEFYRKAEAGNDFKYLQSRGISPDVQKRFHVGFVPDWKSPQAIKTTLEKGGNPDNLPTSPRCIIPRTRTNYLARDTRDDLTADQKKYQKQNQGGTTLYNLQALKDAETLFIVEGEIDCMSIYEARGAAAIALCSTSHVRSFLNYLKENHKGQRFILMLDNDDAGKKAQAELKAGLESMGILSIDAEYPGNDPNEYLQTDREGLAGLISSLQADILQAEAEATENIYNAGDLLEYFKTIEQQPQGFEAKTGFRNLDDEKRNLYGGLHEGLFIIGAISSLGKTTFCLQLADQIAEAGNDVIFFSLEQSKYELMAKSISRETYKQYRDAIDRSGRFIARETMQILNNRRYKYYSPDEKQAIQEGIAAYEKYASNVYIYEGRYKGERLNVEHMTQIVRNHIEKTGKQPVVFVDYLQIIAPTDIRATDKQNTDKAVFELKELSRKYGLPVIAISSFNRDNYLEPVSMASFKESGAIEYSSDILLGLQYFGMEYRPKESDKDRKQRLAEMKSENEAHKRNKEPVQVELKCLKNRNGTLFSVLFNFVSAFNFYDEQYLDEGFTKAGKTPFDSQRKQVV